MKIVPWDKLSIGPWFYIILSTTQWGKYFYPYLKDEGVEAPQQFPTLPHLQSTLGENEGLCGKGGEEGTQPL